MGIPARLRALERRHSREPAQDDLGRAGFGLEGSEPDNLRKLNSERRRKNHHAQIQASTTGTSLVYLEPFVVQRKWTDILKSQ
jgi:hypothetical protein